MFREEGSQTAKEVSYIGKVGKAQSQKTGVLSQRNG
jgi:hypothetical protein